MFYFFILNEFSPTRRTDINRAGLNYFAFFNMKQSEGI